MTFFVLACGAKEMQADVPDMNDEIYIPQDDMAGDLANDRAEDESTLDNAESSIQSTSKRAVGEELEDESQTECSSGTYQYQVCNSIC